MTEGGAAFPIEACRPAYTGGLARSAMPPKPVCCTEPTDGMLLHRRYAPKAEGRRAYAMCQ